MVDGIQPEKALDGREQVVYHLTRERRRGFRDLGSQLFRTRRFEIGTSPGNVFSEARRAAPVTVQLEIELTGNSPDKALWQFGDSGHGFGMVLSTSFALLVAAGNTASNSETDGCYIELDVSGAAGRRMLVTACCVPGAGRLGLFIDGELVAVNQCADGVLLDGLWADGADVGEFGQEAAATLGAFTPGSGDTDAAIVGPLQFYEGMLPRQFGRQLV